MADVFTAEQRSKIMAQIRGRNTRFEVAFLKLLSAEVYPRGYRYRKHHRAIFGAPDVVFVRQKIAIFLDSAFWHGHDYAALKPKLRTPYWRKKIQRNMSRDKNVNRRLRRLGWIVLRIKERELKRDPERQLKRILQALAKASKT